MFPFPEAETASTALPLTPLSVFVAIKSLVVCLRGMGFAAAVALRSSEPLAGRPESRVVVVGRALLLPPPAAAEAAVKSLRLLPSARAAPASDALAPPLRKSGSGWSGPFCPGLIFLLFFLVVELEPAAPFERLSRPTPPAPTTSSSSKRGSSSFKPPSSSLTNSAVPLSSSPKRAPSPMLASSTAAKSSARAGPRRAAPL